MKNIVATVFLTLLVTALAEPQDMRILTHPLRPTREALERLNLTLAWHIRVPTEGGRDGFSSVQIIPNVDAPQIVVQTYQGSVVLIDAETGDTLWRTSVGVPYWSAKPVAHNAQSILTTRRNRLFILNRHNGLHRLYTLDKYSQAPIYGVDLLWSPSGGPAADEEYIVFPMSDRVVAYALPNYEVVEKARPDEQKLETPKLEKLDTSKGKSSFQPQLAWIYLDPRLDVLQAPLLAAGQVSVVGTEGTLWSLNEFERKLRFTFKTVGNVPAQAAQHFVIGPKPASGPAFIDRVAYIGADDSTLYALSMVNSRLLWRYLAGGPILTPPHVNDRDVFVSVEGRGLARVERQTGEEVWLNRSGQRFLAANQKFVYALDRVGNLLVLDQLRGTQLASFDTRDWILPQANELTDRLYLANHDGQIMCLHLKDNRTPLTMKTVSYGPPKKEEKLEPKDKVEEKIP